MDSKDAQQTIGQSDADAVRDCILGKTGMTIGMVLSTIGMVVFLGYCMLPLPGHVDCRLIMKHRIATPRNRGISILQR